MLTTSLGSSVAIGAELSSGSGLSPSGAATENIKDMDELHTLEGKSRFAPHGAFALTVRLRLRI
jgi:hypothetical protein